MKKTSALFLILIVTVILTACQPVTAPTAEAVQSTPEVIVVTATPDSAAATYTPYVVTATTDPAAQATATPYVIVVTATPDASTSADVNKDAPAPVSGQESTLENISSFYQPSAGPSDVYSGSACGDNTLEAQVYATDPQGIHRVDIVYRLIDRSAIYQPSDWTAVQMRKGENGLYTISVDPTYDGSVDKWALDRIALQGTAFTAEIQYFFRSQDAQGYYTHTETQGNLFLHGCP